MSAWQGPSPRRVITISTDVYTYAYADHLGSIVAWSWTGGTPPLTGYLSRYEPFGGYRTRPDVAVNPAISSRGFTGHRGNNTGVQDVQNLNLIYMNARYYMPEIGRFVSADTIVPEPGRPQSYNRYAYSYNSTPPGPSSPQPTAISVDSALSLTGSNRRRPRRPQLPARAAMAG